MSQSPRTTRKRIPKEKGDESPSKLDEEKVRPIRHRRRSSSCDSARMRRSSFNVEVRDGSKHGDDNVNNHPWVVKKMKPKEAKKTDVDNISETMNSEDCNNHGCVSYPTPCPPYSTRNQVMCCSSHPSYIKVMAKLLIFLLLLVSVFYALYRVASGWTRRNEILTLLLFLLVTRMVCKNNWFLPSQYWRILDPCCDKGPRKVDVTVPSICTM